MTYGGIPQKAPKTAVVIVLDISGSTGDLSGTEPKLGVEKGLALQVLGDLGESDYIGVVAFNNAPHTVVPFAQYAERSEPENSIRSLRYGGTTHLSPALAAAHDMLMNFDGGRNVIVISDGGVADSDSSLKAARSMSDDGMTVYALGVGGDTDTVFMTQLGEAGGGGYMNLDAAQGIKVLLGEKETSSRGDGYPLLIINSGHFITKNLALNATVYGYNNVRAKQDAQALVMTGNGNPVVTAWRAGLGRVVAITVDTGNSWTPALYSAGNSKLVTNSINYAVGNPDGLDLRAPDGEVGEPIDVYVYSGIEPTLAFDGANIQFERTGEKLFHSAIYPDSTGFHDISGYTVAVNQPSEFTVTGNNELLPGIIKAGGGRVYNESELEKLIPDITAKKTGIELQVIDLRPVFLLAALLLFCMEVIVRRIMELAQ
ncbi:von Willebrand factor type A domain protein [uncultured archaeon]|nr:von Willebrand factor type A domain protein [uncultured archaeon]